jgi:hypothetical protein
VGEPLSGCARRCRQSPLLLLLRAGRPLDRVFLPAAGAAWLFRERAGQVPAGAPLSVQHRGDRGEVGRKHGSLGRQGADARGGGRDDGRPLCDQRRRFPQFAENAGHSGDGLLRRAVVHAGPRTSTSRARALRLSAPVPPGSRSPRPSPSGSRISTSSNAHRSGSSTTPSTTPRCPREMPGPCATFRFTADGSVSS